MYRVGLTLSYCLWHSDIEVISKPRFLQFGPELTAEGLGFVGFASF
jgi:hypothetical protein